MSALNFLTARFVQGDVHAVSAVVVRALVDECGVRRPLRPLDADAMALRLSEDLRLDSLDQVLLAVAIEDELKVEISDGALAEARTIGDLIATACAALSSRQKEVA
ncbi:hypothetical protein DXH95_02975 [Sphingorhabdus pulchriflava]|uniref:Carrier domain-containing protein n=1 Tax=Sphingorhabdus pulchriflava TaxID=2292257 RepID=A0A371BFP5_9SPHN|nr:phosphopantetheine-binding protein [Sphingorhabdus pulchriflava]RDV06404.1 hypothetical protein DXH95_02975 [Sphingorhabdus pulchriflava]